MAVVCDESGCVDDGLGVDGIDDGGGTLDPPSVDTLPCLSGSGPLAPGQGYCTGGLELSGANCEDVYGNAVACDAADALSCYGYACDPNTAWLHSSLPDGVTYDDAGNAVTVAGGSAAGAVASSASALGKLFGGLGSFTGGLLRSAGLLGPPAVLPGKRLPPAYQPGGRLSAGLGGNNLLLIAGVVVLIVLVKRRHS